MASNAVPCAHVDEKRNDIIAYNTIQVSPIGVCYQDGLRPEASQVVRVFRHLPVLEVVLLPVLI